MSLILQVFKLTAYDKAQLLGDTAVEEVFYKVDPTGRTFGVVRSGSCVLTNQISQAAAASSCTTAMCVVAGRSLLSVLARCCWLQERTLAGYLRLTPERINDVVTDVATLWERAKARA